MATALLDAETYPYQELIGERVRLWPYVAHRYPAATLVSLWEYIRQARATERIFWGKVPFSDSPAIDFATFAHYITHEALPLLAADPATNEMLGMVWFDSILATHRAHINVFFRRKAWGHTAREAVTLAEAYAFRWHRWQYLYASTPWLVAQRMAAALGYTMAVLPGYVMVRGVPRDLHVGFKEAPA